MADRTAFAQGTADAAAMDVLESSGVLHPNITLDKLMDITRQLAQLDLEGKGFACTTFYGSWYVYRCTTDRAQIT
jgi:hypothetical protein